MTLVISTVQVRVQDLHGIAAAIIDLSHTEVYYPQPTGSGKPDFKWQSQRPSVFGWRMVYETDNDDNDPDGVRYQNNLPEFWTLLRIAALTPNSLDANDEYVAVENTQLVTLQVVEEREIRTTT